MGIQFAGFHQTGKFSFCLKETKFFSCADNLYDFEALQAAFIMIKILLREGDTKKTNEVRTTMFDQIIPVTYLLNTRNCIPI